MGVVLGLSPAVANTGPANMAVAYAAPAAYPGSDGRIAFVSKGNIFTILPDGKGLVRLTSLGHSSGPRWSPSGARLAYLYRGEEVVDVWPIDLRGW